MGLFDPGTNVEYIPPAMVKGTEGTVGRDFQTDLLGDIGGFKYPVREIAGMSDAEQAGQGILSNILSGGAFRDPSTSKFYTGYRAESQAEEERAAGALRNRQGPTGMYNSSRAIGEEGRLRGDFSRSRQTMLGQLYEAESARDNPYTRVQAAQQYGSLARNLQQSGLDAQNQAAVMEAMFPYTTGTDLAQQIIGNEVWYGPTVTQTPSTFSQIGSAIGSIGQIAGTVMGGIGSLGSMGGGGGVPSTGPAGGPTMSNAGYSGGALPTSSSLPSNLDQNAYANSWLG